MTRGFKKVAIIVYSIPNCSKCRAAKALLTRLGADFDEFDVMADKARAKEMVEKRRTVREVGNSEVQLPVLDINGTIVEGFDRQKIEDAVNASS